MARTWRGTIDANWGTAGNWLEGSVPTNADDVVFDASSPACDINSSARVAKTIDFTNYASTITFSQQLTVSGSITLGASMTFAGSSPLIINATGTITSNGKACGVPFQTSGAITITVGGSSDWTNNQLVTIGGSNVGINGATRKFMIADGLTMSNSAVISGSISALEFTGSATQAFTLGTNNTFNINMIINAGGGTINQSGSFNIGISAAMTFTYTAGTYNAGGIIVGGAGNTIASNGITWTSITFTINNTATTLSNAMACTGDLTYTGGNVALNGTVNGSTVTFNGNLTIQTKTTGSINGTTTLIANGSGTITASSFTTGSLQNPITISGTYSTTGTLRYQGTLTLNASLTSGTINFVGNTTLACNGFTIPNFTCTTAGTAFTMTTAAGLTISSSLTLTGTSASKITFVSNSGGSLRKITLLNNGATQDIGHTNFTDIDARDGQTLWVWNPTLSNTFNINELTAPKTVGFTSIV